MPASPTNQDVVRRVSPLTIRPGTPTVRTTFQFAADIFPGRGTPAELLRERCITTILRWLTSKLPDHNIPARAYAGESFRYEMFGQVAEAVSIEERGPWSARLVQPDAPFRERQAVAGRVWSTEIALASSPPGLRFAIRVSCASLPYATQEIELTRPRVVVDLVSQFDVRDGRTLEARPWKLSTDHELEVFHDLLLEGRRSLPVLLLTQPNMERLGLNTAPYLLDGDDLARRVCGLAHVVTLPTDLSFRWTAMVGKPWSAFLGAVRTYRPGLSFDEDAPTDHPLALAENVLAFQYRGLKAEEAFSDFLEDQALLYAANKKVAWSPCLFYADAVRQRAEITRRATSDTDQLLKLYQEENQALAELVKKAEDEAEGYNDDAIAAGKERDWYTGENHRLRSRIDFLQHALERKTGVGIDEEIPIPETYDDMAEWVEEHFTGRLDLHQRAVRALKDASYEDVELVYRALLLLANEYRHMEMGHVNGNLKFKEACDRLGLDFGPSISRERAGAEGETYFVKYPAHSVEPRFLEYHLRKGSSKDQRHCLAIYFFWDEKTGQVVVGSLPAHLENRMT